MSNYKEKKQAKLVGIISGTNGSLRPETFTAFSNADLIVHAGNIGSLDVLSRLNKIAPVHAIRGTEDNWAINDLQETKVVDVGEHSLFVIQDSIKIMAKKGENKKKIIITGNKGNARIKEEHDILYINPGSCAHDTELASVALVVISGESRNAEIIKLAPLKPKIKKFSAIKDIESGVLDNVILYGAHSPRSNLPY